MAELPRGEIEAQGRHHQSQRGRLPTTVCSELQQLVSDREFLAFGVLKNQPGVRKRIIAIMQHKQHIGKKWRERIFGAKSLYSPPCHFVGAVQHQWPHEHLRRVAQGQHCWADQSRTERSFSEAPRPTSHLPIFSRQEGVLWKLVQARVFSPVFSV